jgi:hypothetical protein
MVRQDARGSLRRGPLFIPRPLHAVPKPTATGCSLAFERGATAFDVHLEDGGVMNEAVDDSDRHCLVRKDFAPFAEGLVGGDEERAPLVAGADELKFACPHRFWGSEEVRFAADSALEGSGFELLVPCAMQERRKAIIAGFGWKPSLDYRRLLSTDITEDGPKRSLGTEALSRAEPEVRSRRRDYAAHPARHTRAVTRHEARLGNPDRCAAPARIHGATPVRLSGPDLSTAPPDCQAQNPKDC